MTFHTVPQAAKLLHVGKLKIVSWIERGRLGAINANEPGQRPSYRISDEHLREFDERCKVISMTEAKPQRRGKIDIPFKRY